MNTPIIGIEHYHENDILCGKNKLCKTHPGTIYFRSLIQSLKNEYISIDKGSKRNFATRVLMSIQSLQPPGRFLKQSAETGLWDEIGYDQALFKTRQALREGAPRIEWEIKHGIIKVNTVSSAFFSHETCFMNKLISGMFNFCSTFAATL